MHGHMNVKIYICLFIYTPPVLQQLLAGTGGLPGFLLHSLLPELLIFTIITFL
jgi:hypothetical protein